MGALNLIPSTSSGVCPPPATEVVITLTLEYPPTSDTIENDLAPLVRSASHIKLDNITIFPLAKLLPNTPSPNSISYFPSSFSVKKYILEVAFTVVISLAKVYVYVSVSVVEFCTTTVNESVSVFALGNKNFWSTSPVLAVYRNVVGIP